MVIQMQKDIQGVYKRNNICILQLNDKDEGFPIEEYEKIKSVYEKAKKMTE